MSSLAEGNSYLKKKNRFTFKEGADGSIHLQEINFFQRLGNWLHSLSPEFQQKQEELSDRFFRDLYAMSIQAIEEKANPRIYRLGVATILNQLVHLGMHTGHQQSVAELEVSRLKEDNKDITPEHESSVRENLLQLHQSTKHHGFYEFIAAPDGEISIQEKQGNFLTNFFAEIHPDSNTQKKQNFLASLFFLDALDSSDYVTDLSTELISKQSIANRKIVSQLENKYKDILSKKLNQFYPTTTFPATLFEAREFIRDIYRSTLFHLGEKEWGSQIKGKFHLLNSYFENTRQRGSEHDYLGGLREFEKIERQEFLLDLYRNHLSDAKKIESWKDDLINFALYDIYTKADSHPSIYGHPLELYTTKDVELLKLLEAYPSSWRVHSRGIHLTQLLQQLEQRVLPRAREKIRDQYQPLLDRLSPEVIAGISKKKSDADYSPEELGLIVQAKQALMEIELDPDLGRVCELELLCTQEPRLKILQDLNKIRGPNIDNAVMHHLIQEHNQAAIHPKVVIEGGGPTGLLAAITQFEAGGDVSLFEKRSTVYDRTQIVRLDPKWMTMLQFYLGEEYHKLFDDKRHRGIRREDNFGEIITRELENALHQRLTQLISMLPEQGEGLAPLERIAAHEIVDFEMPKQEGEKYQFSAQYQPQYDVADPTKQIETPKQISREADIFICAGGKQSKMKDSLLPSSHAVTEQKFYGVCSWSAPAISGQNPEEMNLFKDFRNVVLIDQSFLSKYRKKMYAEFNGMDGVYHPFFMETLGDFLNSTFKKFITRDREETLLQTRTFENLGLIYLGMEIPEEMRRTVEALESELNNVIAHASPEDRPFLTAQKDAIVKSFQQQWFQTTLESYKIKTDTLIPDSKFLSIFPVEQHRLDPTHMHSHLRSGKSRLSVFAAGDAFASPHFMRYSGLTGGRENVLHLQQYTKGVTRNEEQRVLHRNLLDKEERTAAFVMGRGAAFLHRLSPAAIEQNKTQSIIKHLNNYVEKSKSLSSPYLLTKIGPTSYKLNIKTDKGPIDRDIEVQGGSIWLPAKERGKPGTVFTSFPQLLSYVLPLPKGKSA
jgi:hypothetical protein